MGTRVSKLVSKNLKRTVALLAASAVFLAPVQAIAAVNANLAPAAKISFTFDDGLASAYTQVLPTLNKYGLKATNYVITGCVGMSTVPNTCRANTDTPYMTWAQITALQTAGWEIGSHSNTHPYLATSDATDGQPNVLTPAQVTTELTQSKSTLASHGITATDFSSPYGDYNPAVLAQIAKYYASQRGFADQNNNDWPYNDYIINDYHVEGKTTVAQVKAKIDDAIANKRWLVLTMHDIKATKASTNADDYEWSTANLDQVAAYVKTKVTAAQISSVNINQGLMTGATNLLANSSFNNGIADGWTTDNTATITKDTLSNGSYPDPTNSIKLTSPASGSSHLFSPKVAVDSNTTYGLKNYLNVQANGGGGIGFYIDEYDVNGNWVSGQYKRAENSVFVENLNFSYKPSSASVKTASLQVIVSGTGIRGYLDNSQWFPLTTVTPPVQTNLVAGGEFDTGLTGGWSTNNATAVTQDTLSNGGPASPINSIKMTSASTNAFLFGPKVTVDATKQYSLTSYLNLKARTSGEIAFYVDEYDVNGNWISGQYKLGVTAVSAGDVSVGYKPSSANVKSASLQVIIVANSGITAYVDNIRWYQN